MFQCCLLVLLTVPHAFAVPFSDLSCAQITSLINENQFNSFNDNGWLSYRVERDNGTILTTVVTSAGALEQLDASHRNVRLMRRRAQLALWRSHLTTLSDSRHVVSLLGSAMQCGAHSGIVLSHVNAPLTPPRTLCELLSLAVQLVELLRDLSLPGRTFVLCDWNLRQFGVDRSGRNVQLHDVAALFAVHADAPLGSDLVCSSANHSLVCGQSCVMSANDRDNVIDELSCRGAAHGGELGVCNGLDERLNVWSLGTMLNSLYSSIDVTNNELRDLLTRMRKSAVNARPSIAELQTLLARLSSECTFEAHDDNIASSKSIASNVVDVKLAFGSRNEATRAKGGALMRSAGAAGSTAHCFLHVQFPRLCAPYFLCIGAQKGGTQTFLDWIQEHPNVVMAEQELHFWDYGGIERSLADYYDDLPLVPPGKRRNGAQVVVGEKTPRYSVEAHPMAIHAHFPEMRLVFLVRDPVARAFSHFLHLRRRADQTWRGRQFQFASFGDAVRHSLFNINALHACGNPLLLSWPALHQCVREHERAVTFRELTEHPADMLFRGLYAPIVTRWSRPFFPLGSQLLVLRSEELFERPYESMALVTRFLNLTAIDWRAALPLATARERNRKNDEAGASLASLGTTNMTLAERALLTDFYAPYERDLEALLQQQAAVQQQR